MNENNDKKLKDHFMEKIFILIDYSHENIFI